MPRTLQSWETVSGRGTGRVTALIPGLAVRSRVHFPPYLVEVLKQWSDVALINPPPTGLSDEFIRDVAQRLAAYHEVHIVGSSFGGRWSLELLPLLRGNLAGITLVCAPASGRDIRVVYPSWLLRRLHGRTARAAWKLGVRWDFRFDPRIYDSDLLVRGPDGLTEADRTHRLLCADALSYPVEAITRNYAWLLQAPRPSAGEFAGIPVDFVANPDDPRIAPSALTVLRRAFGRAGHNESDPAVYWLSQYPGEHAQFGGRRRLYRELLTTIMSRRYGSLAA